MKLVLVVALCCLALVPGHGAPRTAVYKYVKCNPSGDQANCVTYQSPKMPWSPTLPNKIPASEARFLEAKAVEDDDVGKDEPLEEEEEEMMQDEEDEDKYLEDDYEEESLANEYEDELGVNDNGEDEDEDDDEEEFEDEDEEEGEQNENTGLQEQEEDEMLLLGEEGESPTTFLSEVGSGSEEGSGSDVTDRLFVPFGGDVGSGDSLNEEANPAARHIPNLRDILKMPVMTMKKPAEEELKEDHLLKP